jgi:alkylhydroperoxidase family enzyme
VSPDRVERADVDRARAAGLDDGQILEINQVASYFAYVNRVVVGLGVTTDGEELGHSPADSADPEDWSHG